MANWITSLNLNDNLYISQLSLPGAHDAATETLSIGKCQDKDLAGLWDAGVRVFDLRPTDGNGCPIYHGVLSTGINLTQALTTITGRLQSNPQEFAIVLMRNENDNGITDNWKSRVTSIMSSFSSYVIPFNNNLRLGDVRGKVIVLSRDYFADGYTIAGWGDKTTRDVVWANDNDAFRFVVQDYYQVGSNATTKENAIKSLLDEARSQTSPNFMFINHTSGYSGSLGINSNINSNANSSNKCALDYINAHPGRTGIIMMDYAGSSSYYGADLCDAIIAQNSALTGLNLPTLPDNTDYYLQNVETGLWLQGNTAKTTTNRDGWNTAANMGTYGRPFRIQNYAADGYKLNTQSGPNALGCNYGNASLLYLDGSIGPTKWKFTGTREATHITINWDRWLSVDNNNRLVNSNPASTWRIWTREERIEAMAEATPENPQDVSWLMVNPELMNNDNKTPQWTISRSGGDQGWPDGFRPNRVYETWNFSGLDFYQTIDVPNGHYRVRAHAMYSPTGIGNTSLADYNNYVTNGDATVFAALYANDNTVKLPSIYSFAHNAQVADYTWRNLGSGVNIVDGWWQIARAMGEDDKYLTEPLDVVVSDGKLRIGIKSLSGNPSSNWVVIGSFSLEYLGVDRITLDEEATSFPESSDYAIVTVNRAFNEGWNAVCLPFDVEASHPLLAGTEIAQFAGDVNTNGNVEVRFTTTDHVEANTPYLIFFPQAVAANQVFDYVNFNPQDVKATGTTFDFMGTYVKAPVVSAGDYVISDGQLAKASTDIMLKGTRTYFKLKTPDAVRSVSMTIDGVNTTGIEATLNDKGQMINEKYYDLRGRKVSKVEGLRSKGLYIQNGKKLIVH
ncbi:MAG: hypothetical protein J6W19_05860 [Prevotella sp.]|nr:hypothetical protein [Prevotella sp.]